MIPIWEKSPVPAEFISKRDLRKEPYSARIRALYPNLFLKWIPQEQGSFPKKKLKWILGGLFCQRIALICTRSKENYSFFLFCKRKESSKNTPHPRVSLCAEVVCHSVYHKETEGGLSRWEGTLDPPFLCPFICVIHMYAIHMHYFLWNRATRSLGAPRGDVRGGTRWRRPIGCLKLQVVFRNRATN